MGNIPRCRSTLVSWRINTMAEHRKCGRASIPALPHFPYSGIRNENRSTSVRSRWKASCFQRRFFLSSSALRWAASAHYFLHYCIAEHYFCGRSRILCNGMQQKSPKTKLEHSRNTLCHIIRYRIWGSSLAVLSGHARPWHQWLCDSENQSADS